MRKYRNCKEVLEIYGVLDFFLRKVTRGLLPFMDKNIPLPSSWEIAEALRSDLKSADLGVRITQGRSLPEQQQIIEISEPYTGIVEKYGGLGEIRDSFELAKRRNPVVWELMFDWSRKGFGELKTMADIAEKYGYCNSTAPYKLRKAFLEEIAFDIFMKFTSKQSGKSGNILGNKLAKKVAKKVANDKDNINAKMTIVGTTEQIEQFASA